MIDEIKSGKQILDEFFQEIKIMPDVDEKVVDNIIALYEAGKLSDKNISNSLLELREKPTNE
jgi:hypothetical protein